MQLVDQNNTPFPASVVLNSSSDGLTLFAKDDNGVPLPSFFVLTPAGGTDTNSKGVKFFVNRTSQLFTGTLDGFTSPTPTPTVTVGPVTSTIYHPLVDPILIDSTVYCTITAIPASGGQARQIMITVLPLNKGTF